MKKLIIIILIAFYQSILLPQVHAQSSILDRKNVIYAEFGGAARFLSLNYERLFPIKESLTATGRIGWGVPPWLFEVDKFPSPIFPISASIFYGKEFSLEAGLGMTIGFDQTLTTNNPEGIIKWINGNVGFRYHKINRPLFLRVNYTPYMYKSCESGMDPGYCLEAKRVVFKNFIGVSIGGRFGK